MPCADRVDLASRAATHGSPAFFLPTDYFSAGTFRAFVPCSKA
jgi:hypothetical protein